MENLATYGRDEYLLYREVVSAAIEYVMGEVVSGTLVPGDQRFPDGFEPEVVNGIRAGGMPGRELLGQFFGGVLSQKGIRMALEEYKATGRLAAWHKAFPGERLRRDHRKFRSQGRDLGRLR